MNEPTNLNFINRQVVNTQKQVTRGDVNLDIILSLRGRQALINSLGHVPGADEIE